MGACGFDRTYISCVERGILNPTVSRLWKIAEVLKTPLSHGARESTWNSGSPRKSGQRLAVETPNELNQLFLASIIEFSSAKHAALNCQN